MRNNDNYFVFLLKWGCWIFLFGLLKIWWWMGHSYYAEGKYVGWENILQSGILIFFSVGLITSTSFDVIISRILREIDLARYLIFIMVPIVAVIYSCLVFSVLLTNNPTATLRTKYGQLIVSVFSFFYSGLIKRHLRTLNFQTGDQGA